MAYKLVEHHRETTDGLVLYRDVRQYSCPEGCRSSFYDFSRAIPAHLPVRILGFIPAPKREVNVVDPLLAGGLIVATVLMIAGFLATTMSVAAKAIAITAIVVFGVLLTFVLGAPRGGGAGKQAANAGKQADESRKRAEDAGQEAGGAGKQGEEAQEQA